ncbi:MAG: helix-turn-helix domain-containing protein [Cellvibrionales bacterium]|jgi:transcriptional regulator with XRE-family HTH domain|nr:helix-turn-helix domain-containing protein [Cellvibrionales bacterium]
MKIAIKQASSVGAVVRAVRKAQGIRQDNAAGSSAVSENFLAKVERGNESVQWGKLFQVMNSLGIRITLDLPIDIKGDHS